MTIGPNRNKGQLLERGCTYTQSGYRQDSLKLQGRNLAARRFGPEKLVIWQPITMSSEDGNL
jgi:hypothetical protein